MLAPYSLAKYGFTFTDTEHCCSPKALPQMSESRLEMLSNRLRKRNRVQKRWAEREGITCFRIYDRDIPQVPVTVDWFEGHVVVSLFYREGDETWTENLEATVAESLGVSPKSVFFRIRKKQKGKDQYQPLRRSDVARIVSEGGHKFLVRLDEYLDTGLFLDHRRTRAIVANQAEGKQFLNLFCYTGSFTVYAAKGGARSSVSVDLSNQYGQWCEENLALNEVSNEDHIVLREDVFTFLASYAKRLSFSTGAEAFELAVVDPPTFSNSAKMESSFDVQRDHAVLLTMVAKVMADEGLVFFSSNRKGFQLDEDKLKGSYEIVEITSKTHPKDFTKRPHKCWRLTRLGAEGNVDRE